jgi:hypothetical protein
MTRPFRLTKRQRKDPRLADRERVRRDRRHRMRMGRLRIAIVLDDWARASEPRP